MTSVVTVRLGAFIALMVMIAFNAAATQEGLPSGWRLPTSEELSDGWRNGDPGRYAEVAGDLNGDGKPDRAVLLISTKTQSLGLFVLLSGSKVNRWFKVDVIDDKQAIHAMGIAIVPRGTYATACGKGYFTCKSGEAKSIQSDMEVINYFKTESANRYIYFDKRSLSFRKAWMSD